MDNRGSNEGKDRAIEPTLANIAPSTAQPEPQAITISDLQSTSAISALGLVAATMLQKHGTITLQVSASGRIEVVPTGELELDRLPEQEALADLVMRGYTDQQMAEYLRQRNDRLIRATSKSSL